MGSCVKLYLGFKYIYKQNVISKLTSYKNENPLKFAIKSEKYSFFIWSEMSLAACVALNSNLHVNLQQPQHLKSLLCVSNTVLSEEDCLQPKDGGENTYWYNCRYIFGSTNAHWKKGVWLQENVAQRSTASTISHQGCSLPLCSQVMILNRILWFKIKYSHLPQEYTLLLPCVKVVAIEEFVLFYSTCSTICCFNLIFSIIQNTARFCFVLFFFWGGCISFKF